MYESLVAEYLEFKLPPYSPRVGFNLSLPKPARHNIIYSIIGVRRCGKTFFMYQLMDELKRQGITQDRMFHFSFDDERIMPFSDHVLSDLLDTYYKLVPSAREGCYLFFDEIQDVPYWTNFVRRVSEQQNVTIVLTGSSSKMLSSDIPTNFRGRSLSWEMWPLSFREFCQFKGMKTKTPGAVYTSQEQGAFELAFDSYLEVGGFPAVQEQPVLERVRLLQGYASEIVTKDVLERFGTASFRVADRFARTALRSTGLKFSVNKQVKDLRSAGISVSDERLYALLDDLEDAHLLFKVGDYSLSIKDNPKSSYKVYSVDPGLSLAVAPASHLDEGQRLETAVFIELKRRFGDNRMNAIASYSAVGCPEVDFVVGDVALCEQHQLIQVSVDADVKTLESLPSKRYKREIENLQTAMRLTGLDAGVVVSKSEEKEIEVPEGRIFVIPAWKWFLEGA